MTLCGRKKYARKQQITRVEREISKKKIMCSFTETQKTFLEFTELLLNYLFILFFSFFFVCSVCSLCAKEEEKFSISRKVYIFSRI